MSPPYAGDQWVHFVHLSVYLSVRLSVLLSHFNKPDIFKQVTHTFPGALLLLTTMIGLINTLAACSNYQTFFPLPPPFLFFWITDENINKTINIITNVKLISSLYERLNQISDSLAKCGILKFLWRNSDENLHL